MGAAELRDALYIILDDDDATEAGPEAIEICISDDKDALSVAALVQSLRIAGVPQRFVVVFGDERVGSVDIARVDEHVATSPRSGEAERLTPAVPAAALRPVRYVCAECNRVRVFAGVMNHRLVRCRLDGVEMRLTP